MNLLQQIVTHKKAEIEQAKTTRPLQELHQRIKDTPKPIGFQRALRATGFGIIAEIKKKSPSMSDMIPANVQEAAEAYKASDLVKAVSILTDWKYFGMTIEDLARLKQQIGKPVLRKDFIIDEHQVLEARAFGADAILLMACVLNREELRRLFGLATELGLDVLFECHSKSEIEMIPKEAQIYGINSREFKASNKSFRYRASRLIGKLKLFELFGVRDFSTDLGLFKELINALPQAVVKVAESGVKPSGIAQVRDLGFDCALIGTAFLKSPIGVSRTLAAFQEALESQRAPSAAARNAAAVRT
jgi:indole-3-glycerol phosphate synthase